MNLGQGLIDYIIEEEESFGVDPAIADQLYIGEGGACGPDWFIEASDNDMTYAVLRRTRFVFHYLKDVLREQHPEIENEFIDVVVEPCYEGACSVVIFLPALNFVLGFWDMKMSKFWHRDISALNDSLQKPYEELETNLKKVLASK